MSSGVSAGRPPTRMPVAGLPRDEIDMDDVASKAEDHAEEAGIHPRDERKKTGFAAASEVAFPAEQRVLES